MRLPEHGAVTPGESTQAWHIVRGVFPSRSSRLFLIRGILAEDLLADQIREAVVDLHREARVEERRAGLRVEEDAEVEELKHDDDGGDCSGAGRLRSVQALQISGGCTGCSERAERGGRKRGDLFGPT